MALATAGELLGGRYRRIRTIGVGGMARVELARDTRLGRKVAIKRLHSDSPEEAVARFAREAPLGACLNHPNLVAVHDVETDGESVLIVMELVQGESLADAIARGPLEPERVARIVHDVAAGLDHAHAQGVVHRDVKPANVLLRRDGIAKLADLGIATAAEATAITRPDAMVGTATYMAPEQLDGREASPLTDVYALAAVAFEALSGRAARGRQTPLEVAHQVVSAPSPDLRSAWRDAPAAAATALARGMASDPSDRHRSAGALAADLARGLRSPRAPRPHASTASTVPAATVETAVLPAVARAATGRVRKLPQPSLDWLAIGAAGAMALVLAIGALSALLGGADVDGRQAASAAGGADRAGEQQGANGGGSGSSHDGGSLTGAPAAASDPSDLNARGYELMQEGRYDEAIPLLWRAVAQYQAGSKELTYAYALYNLGRSLRLAGRPERAVPVLERRLTIPNQIPTVRRELQAARRQSG